MTFNCVIETIQQIIFSALHADTHPRLEPFSPGQVYNSSKGTQVHVIGAATT